MTPVIEALLDPSATRHWSAQRWDAFLRIARNFDLLPKFSFRAEQAGITESFPQKIKDHLIAAGNVGKHHRRTVEWESQCIHNILSYQDIDFILLKGAAYIMAGLPAGEGRKVSDIDILVRKEDLSRTEQVLLQAGWAHTKHDPYDQKYYRRWMHELPPLKHRERKTLIDVHHTILPESGRLHPNPKLLWQGAQTCGKGGWRVLSPEDMVLHSAVHLFQDGDLSGGLRDLFDLDDLMRDFGEADPDFWNRLLPRALALDLIRPMFYALFFCREILGTPIPDEVMKHSAASAPHPMIGALMAFLARRTLVPLTPEGQLRPHQFEKTLLYIRAHWLRMPPLLLARHLSQKFFRRSAKEP
ncbi:Uncharacterised nucleotidyltransferase [Geoalkalibacter ferrihydriticus]|uniref:Uncharacterized protein n=2 Tax=Geoalkalibacter ferrihydriticus TaxID=392333 RepID=A0A0C2HFY1_9BACT|nr:nucleotidyltransferase family protein [Geoalkalibacter ferrihydriticus]KIH75846.1 hypothetical protein GFER_14790 [Geoalkalibacter ferrihydriticus DSM 17813]SDM67844.1 Uncharacterised nucleotidyltransferase [Geoalkalibacter ferrihydriticus]